MPTQPFMILLAEDDDGHATLVERNLRRAGLANEIVRARDGQEALEYVRCEGKYASRASQGPLLVLMDIKMPRLDGVEALRQLKADKRTERVPVIMLTTTDDPREIQNCYDLGCNIYVTKPVTYEPFVEAIRRLGLLLAIVCVPPEEVSA
jgi:CheY-like chemotaxis protein